MIIPLQDAIKISRMKLSRIRLLSTVFLAPLVVILGSCTKVNELEVRMDDTIKPSFAPGPVLVNGTLPIRMDSTTISRLSLLAILKSK
jgi:hypothetical protein